MFNPKVNSLLDEQLAVSGLEMNIVGALIGAGTAIVGGIMASRQASKANQAKREAADQQSKHNEEVVKLQNEHYAKQDAADKANYYAMRDFNYETQIQDWKRGKEIQDYNYLQSLKQYEKSLSIGTQQFDSNAQAEQLGIESQQNAIQEAFIQQQFQRRTTFDELQQVFAEANINRASELKSLKQGSAELAQKLRIGTREQALTLKLGRAKQAQMLRLGTGEQTEALRLGRAEQSNILAGIQNRKKFGRLNFDTAINDLMARNNIAKETLMVEGLIRQGAAQAAGQAGVSATKTQQSNLAQMQRSLMGLEAELSGSAKKAALQLAELNSSLIQEEAEVGLNLKRLESTAGLNLKRLEATAALNLRELEKTSALNLRRLEGTAALDFRRLKDTTGLNLRRMDSTIKAAKRQTRFNLDVMEENMKSNIAETQRNIEQIRLQRQVADINTKAGMMLFPERLSYSPRPEQPPERIFVERMKAIPGFVPEPQQQSTWAPLVQGGLSAASHIASIDFNQQQQQQQQQGQQQRQQPQGGPPGSGSYGSNVKIGTGTNYFDN